MLYRIALAFVAVTLALPAAAAVINPPSVFFDFSSTQGSNYSAATPQAPAAFIAGKVVLSPSLGRLKLSGDRRVRVADRRARDEVTLVLVFKDDDTFVLRHPDGTAFRGDVRRAAHNRRKLDLLLFPPDGQRFIEQNTAHAFGFEARPRPERFVEDDTTRITAKINRDGDRVKLKVRSSFRADEEGERVDGVALLVLIVDLDD